MRQFTSGTLEASMLERACLTSGAFYFMVRLRGIAPPPTVPETIALSTELQAQNYHIIIA